MKLLRPANLADATGGFSRASTATYTDASGMVRTAAVNEPRLRYADISGTGAATGLLIEAAATNLVLRSAEFDNAAWTKTAATVEVNVAVAPDGTMTAERIVPTTTSTTHHFRRVVTVPAEAAPYTQSIYFRADGDYTTLRLRMSSGTTYLGDAVFNAATGAWVGNGGAATRQAEQLAGGWWRVSVTYTSLAADTTVEAAFWLVQPGTASTTTFAGDGVGGIMVWGAQLERGSLTSYIPTVAASVTRAADSIASASGLLHSSVAETDAPEWSAATNYAVGARVMRTQTHRVYEALVTGADSTPPESAPARWLDLGPTNRWAMLDQSVGTLTSASGALNVVLLPGFSTGLSLMELVGIEVVVTVRQHLGGPVVYQRTVPLDETPLADWYEYFYSAPNSRTDLTLTDLPAIYGAEVCIAITGGAPRCGLAAVGAVDALGDTEYGAGLGIVDYSRKDTDQFGRTAIVRRSFAKRMSARLVFPHARLPRLFRLLSEVRATPCVWIATDAPGYDPLAVFGFYRDFNIDVSFPAQHHCTLEIEGLI